MGTRVEYRPDLPYLVSFLEKIVFSVSLLKILVEISFNLTTVENQKICF